MNPPYLVATLPHMKISISIRSLLIALLAMASTSAMAETRMQVSVASTPVYTQPSAGAQQLGNATSGEIVFVSRIDGEWAAIAPLDRHSVWLNKDFVEGNRVIAKNIQVRSGPGVQYDVVGSLERGAPVMPLGEEGEWCKIAPPSSATLWVRTRDLSEIATRTTPIREVATVTTPEIQAQPEPPAPPPPDSSTPPSTDSAELPPPASATEPPPSTPEPPAAEVTEVAAATPSPEPPPPPATAKIAPSTPNTPAPKPQTRPTPAPTPPPAASSPMGSAAAPARPVAIVPHPVPVATRPVVATPTLRPATALPAASPSHPAPQPRTSATAIPPRPSAPLRPASKTVPAPSTVVAAHKPNAPEVQVEQSLVDDLDLDNEIPTQGKAVQVEGELRNAPFMAGSPSRYRLVTREDGILEMVCHVHGHSDILREYVGKGVSIRGREFWVETSDMPVVVVGQIVPLSPASEPVMF